jgi:hypothetical protein
MNLLGTVGANRTAPKMVPLVIGRITQLWAAENRIVVLASVADVN